MNYETNATVAGVEAPPIAEAMSWIDGRPGNRLLINLCQAVPSYPPAPELRDHLALVVNEPDTGLYTEIRGLQELRLALANHMAEEYAGNVNADDTIITAGCNQAFCVALSALARAGDNVILSAPFYFNHQMWLTMQGIEIRPIFSIQGNEVVPRTSDAAAMIDGRTRAIVLVTPNNPTGVVMPPENIRAFYTLAKTHGLALVIDETYKDFRMSRSAAHSLFQLPDWREVLVQLYSFSKAYALPGYRVGSIIAGSHINSQIEKIMDCVAICAPRISQEAALFSLRSLADWKEEKRQLMNGRLTALQQAMSRAGMAYELTSAGAYFAYVRHPFRGVSGKEVAQRLAREHSLLCLPGSMFGPEQENYLRLAFANVEASLMTEVADRLVESQQQRIL